MKRIVKYAVALFLVFFSSMYVCAETTGQYVEEQLHAGGAIALWEQLDSQTRELFERVGVSTLSDLSEKGMDAAGVTDAAWQLLLEQGKTPFAVMGMLLAAVSLCAFSGGIKDSLGSAEVNGMYQTVCALSVCTVVLIPFLECVRAVNDALSGVAVFMGSFAPVYVAVLAASGNIGAAFSYQSILLIVSQILGFLTGGVLLPLLLSSLALGIITVVTDNVNIGKIGEMLLKFIAWSLGILSALFTTVLTVNGMLGAAGDGLGSRIARLSIASMVPVVGGALSEAFLTVKGCIGVVRTTVGAFGGISAILLLLPTLLRCTCWQLCFWVCATTAEMFEVKGVSGLLKTMQQVSKNMIALLSISGLFMVVATIVVARGTV